MIDYIHEQKVTGLILRRTESSFQLLVFKFSDSYPYYRLPGGGVEENESILDAVYRKISEESGIIKEDLVFMRKVGELKYYKPIIQKKVHMHNFLFLYQGEYLEEFQFVVKSNDKDNGFLWNYEWVSSDKLVEIDPELKQLVNPYNLPEFFMKPRYFGLNRDCLTITPTDIEWERIYELEEIQIREIMDFDLVIHHIGSTSVKNFVAKPIIDILIGIEEKGDCADIVIEKLQSVGYKFHGEYGISGRYYFTKGTHTTTYFHIHMFEKNAIEIIKHLKIKKILEENDELKEEYAIYKKNYESCSRLEYTEKKQALMEKMLAI